MRVEYQELTKEIIEKYGCKNHIGGGFKNLEVAFAYDEQNNELGYAVITPKDNYNITSVFNDNFIGLLEYSEEEYEELFDESIDKLKECNYLNYIEVHEKDKGIGTIFLNHIKEKFKNLWLYSIIKAEDFYMRNGFEELGSGDHNYIYLTE